jgi:hypothetical protein
MESEKKTVFLKKKKEKKELKENKLTVCVW